LLRATDAEVFCLVRGSNREEAAGRLEKNLCNYELSDILPSPRIVPVCGDFSEPQLGLSSDEYLDLAESIDTIYHNGANTNYMAPYQMLRSANVAGMIEILRFATLNRVKPVHFVSTMSVLNAARRLVGGTIDEDEPLGPIVHLKRGYAQSKWVAETLIREAMSRGLPATIHRPGRIICDSVSGAASATDHVAVLLKTCIEMSAAPDAEDFRTEFTPVDYVARAIVALSRSGDALGHTFHQYNPELVPISDVYQAISAQGYTLRVVPREQWQEQLIEHAGSSDDPVMWGLAQIVSVLGAAAARRPSASDARRPRTVDGTRTIELLQQRGVNLPSVDAGYLARFLDYMARSRVLPPAPNKSGCL
jgi:thioester reductase-like protein